MCLNIVIMVNTFIFEFFVPFQIRDDEYDWPTPYDIRNNEPDMEALDNLEPYQTDDFDNGEVCILCISNISDISQLLDK